MPSKSIAQQHLMQAAEHGADFAMAKKVRKSMSHKQMHEFAVGPEEGKPQHVLKGDNPGVVHENKNTFQRQGLSEADATKKALRTQSKGHPNRHKNLGKFLHGKKNGRSDGSPDGT